jgi:hypothetical protein
MNLYKSLLFLHGHVADVDLARSLGDAGDAPSAPASPSPAKRAFKAPRRDTPGFFGSLWYLGGLDDLDPRIGEHGEAYAPKYGRRGDPLRRFGAAASPAADPCPAGCH